MDLITSDCAPSRLAVDLSKKKGVDARLSYSVTPEFTTVRAFGPGMGQRHTGAALFASARRYSAADCFSVKVA